MRPPIRASSFVVALAGLLTTTPAAMAAPVNVDTFAKDQGFGINSLGSGGNAVKDAATILQTERNAQLTASNVSGGGMSVTAAGGQITYTRPSGSAGEFDLWWDGDNGLTFTNNGLGGADLTAGGNTGFRIQSVSSSSTTMRMQIYVYSGPNTSHKFFVLPAGSGTIEIPFAELEDSGTGANFTAAGAIYLYTADTVGAWTLTLDSIELAHLSRIFNDGFETGDKCVWSGGSSPC